MVLERAVGGKRSGVGEVARFGMRVGRRRFGRAARVSTGQGLPSGNSLDTSRAALIVKNGDQLLSAKLEKREKVAGRKRFSLPLGRECCCSEQGLNGLGAFVRRYVRGTRTRVRRAAPSRQSKSRPTGKYGLQKTCSNCRGFCIA